MNTFLWRLLDSFFIASHLLIILFVLFGWMYRRLHKIHLIVMILTLFSWVVLGLRYGFGYCFWTDWHWQVRAKIGSQEMPSSFVKFLADSLTGFDHDPNFIDVVTATLFVVALVLSLLINFKSKARHDPVG